MAWYPFDQQTCLIEMITDGVLDNYAQLVPGILDFSGRKELTQYYVKSFTIAKDRIQSKKGIVISVTLGRRLLGTFLTIFFPTILLNVIGYSTNYFKEFFFEVRIFCVHLQLFKGAIPSMSRFVYPFCVPFVEAIWVTSSKVCPIQTYYEILCKKPPSLNLLFLLSRNSQH